MKQLYPYLCVMLSAILFSFKLQAGESTSVKQTIAAIEKVMIDAGVTPPKPPSELASENEFYK